MANEIKAAGGEMYAIAVDTPEQSRKVVEKHDLPFQILADENREIIRKYDLSHPGGGLGGTEVAVPAHVLIARGGKIAWRHRAVRIQDRPDPQMDMAEIRKLKQG